MSQFSHMRLNNCRDRVWEGIYCRPGTCLTADAYIFPTSIPQLMHYIRLSWLEEI